MATKTLSKNAKTTPARSTSTRGKSLASKRPSGVKPAHMDATVPPKEFLDSYISRKVSGKLSEFDIFQYARESKQNVLIEGPTGPGKTSAVMAYAAKAKRPFYAVPSNIGIEPSQLFGKFIPDGEGGFKWVDGPVTKIVREGGVLLINEVNFIPERVATVLFGLLDKRRQISLLDHEAETIDAHEDLLIVADMNPEYEGTRPLNKAFRNRFAVQLWWDYDPAVEKKLIKSESLRGFAGQVRDEAAKGTYETPISTNMLMEFERIALGLDLDFAKMNFINHFASDERGAIKVLLDTWSDNISADLFPEPVAVADEPSTADGAYTFNEDDLVDPETGSRFPLDHPIWNDRDNQPDGWVDPEWGIKGSDWTFEVGE